MAAYIIITPAHNEARLIEGTIKAVLAQTVRPARWVIVNDASTDETAEIVARYAQEHTFIKLVNRERPPGRHFGNKALAFNLGFAEVCKFPFDYISSLDADITIEPHYFEMLLKECEKRPKLGITGGMIHTCLDGNYVSQEVALDSVAGAVQFFRRECFEQIGGYRPLALGGIDTAAEFTARMKGWETRTFPEHRILEHRLTGSATASPLTASLRGGRRMHALGYSPLFFIVRCVYRALEKPRIVGSGAALAGFIGGVIRGDAIALPPEVVAFVRAEQHQKLRKLLRLPARTYNEPALQRKVGVN
jgi:hypothetical protein